MMPRPENYDEAVHAVAELLASERSEELRVKHVNEARKILWPHLSDESQGNLVMR